jgi:hypothetical protein
MSMAGQPVPTSGHERRDISPATVLRWGAGIFVLLILAATAMWLLLGRYDRELAAESPAPSPLAGYGPQEPPEPRLQVDPATDIARLRATEQQQLDGFGWVDRQAGTVRIPIERAMQLLAERRGSGGAP